MRRFFGMFFILALIGACSSDNGGGDSTDDDVPDSDSVIFARGPMLANWADNIIIPSYESFSVEMANLTLAYEAFKVDANTTNLIAFRASWLSAYTLWQRIAMFEIGPAETADLRFSLNTYPTNTDKIDSNITSGTYDLSLPSNREAKGFPALDYLINGLGETDEAITSRYTTAEAATLISYIDDILTDMNTLSNQVLAEWKADFRDTFVLSDGSSATASTDRYVNDYIFYVEKFLRAGKMGIPLGVFSGSPLPGNLEAFYEGDVSNELFLEGLQAVQDLFNGKHFDSATTGESLASYLDALNTIKDGEDLNTLINNQLNQARVMVTGLDTFRTEIENNTPPTNMLLAYDEVQRIIPLLKVDMVSAMSINIDFVDADGD